MIPPSAPKPWLWRGALAALMIVTTPIFVTSAADTPEPATTATLAQALQDSAGAVVLGIYFETNSAKLKAASDATLTTLRDLLEVDPELRLTIAGHTDSTADEAHNLALSRNRARAVADWLTERGVDAGRLTAVGFGESRPIADNDSPDGRTLNRRVEVSLSD